MNTGLTRKVVLVVRKTRLDELVARYHAVAQARFALERLGANIADYEREHETYVQAKERALAAMAPFQRRQVIERHLVPNFLFGPDDIVMVLGPDGLVANTMKYLDGQPLVGVNPDPARYDGLLLPFKPADLATILPAVAQDKRAAKSVTMAKATLSNRQELHAANDLFVGPKTHCSARYEIALGEESEVQSSSGVIIATGLGSTAWLKSVVIGARGITLGGNTLLEEPYRPLPWDTDHLMFAVREPFPSVSSQASIVFGTLARGRELRLRSLMPENGVIFSDGLETDCLPFNSGAEVRIGIASRRGQLVQ